MYIKILSMYITEDILKILMLRSHVITIKSECLDIGAFLKMFVFVFVCYRIELDIPGKKLRINCLKKVLHIRIMRTIEM